MQGVLTCSFHKLPLLGVQQIRQESGKRLVWGYLIKCWVCFCEISKKLSFWSLAPHDTKLSFHWMRAWEVGWEVELKFVILRVLLGRKRTLCHYSILTCYYQVFLGREIQLHQKITVAFFFFFFLIQWHSIHVNMTCQLLMWDATFHWLCLFTHINELYKR